MGGFIPFPRGAAEGLNEAPAQGAWQGGHTCPFHQRGRGWEWARTRGFPSQTGEPRIRQDTLGPENTEHPVLHAPPEQHSAAGEFGAPLSHLQRNHREFSAGRAHAHVPIPPEDNVRSACKRAAPLTLAVQELSPGLPDLLITWSLAEGGLVTRTQPGEAGFPARGSGLRGGLGQEAAGSPRAWPPLRSRAPLYTHLLPSHLRERNVVVRALLSAMTQTQAPGHLSAV